MYIFRYIWKITAKTKIHQSSYIWLYYSWHTYKQILCKVISNFNNFSNAINEAKLFKTKLELEKYYSNIIYEY